MGVMNRLNKPYQSLPWERNVAIKAERLVVLLVLCAVLGVGCGPTILIRHRDITAHHAKVRIDGNEPFELSYGEARSVRVDRGLVRIRITQKDAVGPWLPNGSAVLAADGDIVVTLKPPAVTVGVPASGAMPRVAPGSPPIVRGGQ